MSIIKSSDSVKINVSGNNILTVNNSSITTYKATLSGNIAPLLTIYSENSTGTDNLILASGSQGISGIKVITNGQSQFQAQASNYLDRVLRLQTYSDGNTYLSSQGLLGSITSDIIIRTSHDDVEEINSGSIRFALMGVNKMAITPTGIKVGNQTGALTANADLEVSGSVIITGSMNINGTLLVNGQSPGGGASKGFVIAMAASL